MKSIFFIAAFNAFFFIVLLLRKHPKALHDKILIAWLAYLGIATSMYAFTMDLFSEAPILTSGVISLFLLHGPFMYLYVSELTLENKSLKLSQLFHFIPFIAFALYLAVASQFPKYAEGISVDHSLHLPQPPLLFVFFLILTALSGPVYFILAFRKYRTLQKTTAEVSAKDIDLDWLGQLITIFGIVWTLFIIVAVIHHAFHLFTIEFCTNGLFLSLSGFIILIGYFGLNQKEVFINFQSTANKITEVAPVIQEKPMKPKLVDEELENCFVYIESYMKSEKPYLEPELTLPKLAQDLEIPAHHLSQVINEIHQRNFFDFINQYRVEEVKRKMEDKTFDNYSLLAIAFESGFNSKSAFNRVFKKMTSMTPSQYKSSIAND